MGMCLGVSADLVQAVDHVQAVVWGSDQVATWSWGHAAMGGQEMCGSISLCLGSSVGLEASGGGRLHLGGNTELGYTIDGHVLWDPGTPNYTAVHALQLPVVHWTTFGPEEMVLWADLAHRPYI